MEPPRRLSAVIAIALGLALALGWGYYAALKRAWIRHNVYDIRSPGGQRLNEGGTGEREEHFPRVRAREVSDPMKGAQMLV